MSRLRSTTIAQWQPSVGVPEMLHDWLTHLFAAGHSPSTVRAYYGHLTRFQRAHPDLLLCTNHDLEEYIAARRVTHSPESRKAIRAALRSFYRWAHHQHLIGDDPSLELPAIHIPRTVARLADDATLQIALINASPRDRALILLGRMAGLRLSEISSLHTDQRQNDILTITGKGGKTRLVPVNDTLMAALLTLERQQGSGYYFPGLVSGHHLHPMSVNKIITRVTGTNPHSLRHAAATSAYANTHDLRAVQEFLGHSSLATTERYLHVNLDQVRRVGRAADFPSGPSAPRRSAFRPEQYVSIIGASLFLATIAHMSYRFESRVGATVGQFTALMPPHFHALLDQLCQHHLS